MVWHDCFLSLAPKLYSYIDDMWIFFVFVSGISKIFTQRDKICTHLYAVLPVYTCRSNTIEGDTNESLCMRSSQHFKWKRTKMNSACNDDHLAAAIHGCARFPYPLISMRRATVDQVMVCITNTSNAQTLRPYFVLRE